MKRVILESPFAGDTTNNIAFAIRCAKECLSRGEAPFASHLLYPQLLNDLIPFERRLGIEAGQSWLTAAEYIVAYIDRGISPGMKSTLQLARERSVPIEYRFLERRRIFSFAKPPC